MENDSTELTELKELTEEQKQYRKEYDELVTEAQEIINPRMKKWDHIPVRPGTFDEFRKLRGDTGGMKSDDAFVRELMKAYKEKINQSM